MGSADTDPEEQERLAAFRRGLAGLGWSEGSNLHADIRWSAGDATRAVSLANELVTLQPDAILADSTPATAAVQHQTQSIPIVFVSVADPVGSGFVKSEPRPGGNITGFLKAGVATMAEKWLELLNEVAPHAIHVAAIFNPQTAPYSAYYLKPLQAAAPKVGVTVSSIPVQTEEDIDAALTKLARDPNSSLIIMIDSFLFAHRKLILDLTTRHKIPAISQAKELTVEGGLMTYGVNGPDLFKQAASYVDRILRGAKPSELPVQAPTKFDLVINLKTATALGLTVPPTLLATADELIE
jgi:putative ABC transport system substrate-binding protein